MKTKQPVVALLPSAMVHSLPLSDWGDSFRPNPSPIAADQEIVPVFPPPNDCIGHYQGHPACPPVFRRPIGHLHGPSSTLTGQWDVLVCPEMAIRVEIPRGIRTWGELLEYLTGLIGETPP
jgi:hypothetical protein